MVNYSRIRPITAEADLPDNIVYIVEDDPLRAFNAMAQAVRSPPVNAAVWKMIPEDMETRVSAMYDEVASGHFKAILSPVTNPRNASGWNVERYKASITAAFTHLPLSDWGHEGAVLWCDRQIQLIDAGIQLWGRDGFTPHYARKTTYFRAAEALQEGTHIDGWGQDEIDLPIETRQVRIFGVHFGPGTILFDNEDVCFARWDGVWKGRLSNPDPVLWEVQISHMSMLTPSSWPHRPILHSFAFPYKGTSYSERLVSDFFAQPS